LLIKSVYLTESKYFCMVEKMKTASG